MFNRKLKRLLADRERLLKAAILLSESRSAQIRSLQYALTSAQTQLYALQQMRAEEVQKPEIKFAKQPLYLSEEEEDVQWQYDQELINLKQYQALLKELDFQNSEVQFAEELTENFHY